MRGKGHTWWLQLSQRVIKPSSIDQKRCQSHRDGEKE